MVGAYGTKAFQLSHGRHGFFAARSVGGAAVSGAATVSGGSGTFRSVRGTDSLFATIVMFVTRDDDGVRGSRATGGVLRVREEAKGTRSLER